MSELSKKHMVGGLEHLPWIEKKHLAGGTSTEDTCDKNSQIQYLKWQPWETLGRSPKEMVRIWRKPTEGERLGLEEGNNVAGLIRTKKEVSSVS